MDDERQWWTVCLSYHDEKGIDDLVLDAVRPLLAEFRPDGDVTAGYYLRHWRRGPHVRLNVSTTSAGLRHDVLPAVDRHVGRFLRDRPSTARLDVAALAPEYRRLAWVEEDDGPLWPVRPDNSISVEPYESRAPVLGGDEAAEFVAAFHVASTPAAFAAAVQMRAEGRRLLTALELMAATAHAFSGVGLQRGFVSFRAHADIYLARHPGRSDVRAAWDRLYDRSGAALRERLIDLVSAPAAGGVCGEWTGALASVLNRGYALVDAGAMFVNRVRVDREPPGEATEFLRALLANQDFRDRMMPTAAFRRYRLVLNMLYLHLTKLGIRPAERAMLGHLLANAVEGLYGVDAATVVADAAARVP
jgi:hypothetical protein